MGIPSPLPAIAWGKKVSIEFKLTVLQMCKTLNWPVSHADFLMTCMAFETAETFTPYIRNGAGSGATGLIQFMPATAIGLNTTTDKLARMSACDQLLYVYRYFKPYARRINTLTDMYMAILYPKYISSPDDTVVMHTGTKAYLQNRGLDRDKDGEITKREISSIVIAKYHKGMQEEYFG